VPVRDKISPLRGAPVEMTDRARRDHIATTNGTNIRTTTCENLVFPRKFWKIKKVSR
jgi:hypothetical protein